MSFAPSIDRLPRWRPLRGLCGLSLVGFLACSASNAGGDGVDSSNDAGSDAGDLSVDDGGLSGTGGSSTGTGGGLAVLPPEVETEKDYKAPVVTGAFVWTANPDSNLVARIDARSAAIEVFDAGDGPTYLAALPAGKTSGAALVIDTRSDQATIFMLKGKGADQSAAPSQETISVDLQAGASAWAVGPLGSWAIAWSRFSDGLLGTGDGYQDITVLGFGKSVTSTVLSVGFRPNRVFLASDEKHAYVVSDPGISVIDLTIQPPSVSHELTLPSATAGLGRDVSFTADGSHALVRLEGEAKLLVVDTATDARVEVPMPRTVTDLDLAQSGKTGVAVMRANGETSSWGGAGPIDPDQSLVALFDVDQLLADPSDFQLVSVAETVGSAVLSDDGQIAALYTNATNVPALVILDIGTGEQRRADLRAPVAAVFLAPNGDHAVAVFAPTSVGQPSGGFAAVPLRKDLPVRIVGTHDAPVFVSLTDSAGLVTTLDNTTNVSWTYVVQFPGLRVDALALPSKALSSGVVPTVGLGFVAQEHPDGRISFVDLSQASIRTVTGFELGNEVTDQ